MDGELLELARAYAQEAHHEELDLLRTLARIPSPTGHEERRAAFVADWLRMQGATRVEVTAENNVLCWLGGRAEPAPAGAVPEPTDNAPVPTAPRDLEVFAAHLDIVAPDTEELPLREDACRLYAPGVGDDTANLVALLMATKYLLNHLEALAGRHVLVVANSCEEGLGNLAGTKALFSRYSSRIRSFVTFDLYLPQCISSAVGSQRWRVTVRTQGGHSLQDFGRPNAVERLCALIERFYHDPLPADLPARATYNVGRIEGGGAVNAIAAEASALVEYRSTSQAALTAMRARLEAIIEGVRTPDVEVSLEEIGTRPGNGPIDPQALARLEQRAARTIAAVTGLEPDRTPASTDANVPLSLGIPAICVGAVRGALLHTRDEWIEKASLEDGLAVALSLMLQG